TVSFPEADSPVYFAAGVSTGANQYILLSEDLVADFTEDELKAVVSHEAAHIENGDTKLAILVVFGSILTVLGRNLFYAQLDFRKREFKADKSAAEATGPEPVKRALRRFEENDRLRANNVTGLGISSFGGATKRPEGVAQYFDLFFGEYTIREAHPSVDERVSRLTESESL
ncbi:M48 family metalloprotease, partial [Halorubrum sp. AD140]|uniref:M48 family metallopeptidase n=1 Tax=Halorubrum sp. AD140 TaxID=3050073 RepID=UPI002ACCA41A